VSAPLYPISSRLVENSSRHCVSFAIGDGVSFDNGIIDQGFPDENSPNGTLTIIKSDGKFYGITCWHVIEYLRELKKESNGMKTPSLYTMTPRPQLMVDKFIQLYSDLEYRKIDVAISEIKPELVEFMKKEAIDIDDMNMPSDIKFGYAVGFPLDLKYVKKEYSNSKIKMISLPTVAILAEIDVKPQGRFQLFSEFDKPQGYETYSGMSGGPIFWSDLNNYGIYGIISQSNSGNALGAKDVIIVVGELATPDIIRGWIEQIPLK
jgi:hypothetical protein